MNEEKYYLTIEEPQFQGAKLYWKGDKLFTLNKANAKTLTMQEAYKEQEEIQKEFELQVFIEKVNND